MTVLARAQAVADSLKSLEAICSVNDVPQDVLSAIANHHQKLNHLRIAFGVDLVEPENLRSGVIAFSGGSNKDDPKPTHPGT